jgi:hypothetical protein
MSYYPYKLSTRYIKTAIISEMQNKGYRHADNPDFWVKFNIYTKEKNTRH